MFSTVNHFQMLKPGSVNGRRGALQIQTREPIESIRTASDFANWPGNNKRRHHAHQNMQSNQNEYYLT